MNPNSAPQNLGPLRGTDWVQYTNAIGQVYYYHPPTQTSQYHIPQGWEDAANDTWVLDTTKPWPQWNNSRTGRATFIDPNAGPPQTYLDDLGVRAHITTLQRVPESLEHVYRRPMAGILQILFPRIEGYDVVQETGGETTRPDFVAFKVFWVPGGTLYSYEYLLVECKRAGITFESTEPQLYEHLANGENESKNAYGMIQCGFNIQFYKHENGQFEKLGGPMHFVNDVALVTQWAEYMKSRPLGAV